MKKTAEQSACREFGPAPEFKTLYWINFFGAFAFLALVWLFPAVLFAPPFISVPSLVIALAVFLFTAWWIPKYCSSITYSLTGTEITWRRGVWFRTTGIVPYNRITNVDIAQGPVSRALGIAALKVQTAGYSANKMNAELKLEGIRNFEELREIIIDFVRSRKPVAVESFETEETGEKILKELVAIRKLLARKK